MLPSELLNECIWIQGDYYAFPGPSGRLVQHTILPQGADKLSDKELHKCGFCIMGVVEYCGLRGWLKDNQVLELVEAIDGITGTSSSGVGLGHWNDHPGRTKNEVMYVLTTAEKMVLNATK